MAEAAPAGGTVAADVGWLPDSPQAALAFPPPRPLGPEARAMLPPVDPLTGAGALAERVLEVPAAFDVRLRVTPPGVRPVRFLRVEEAGSLSEEGMQGLFTRLEESSQRRPDLPVLQLSLNFALVTDEPASLMLTPPFLHPGFRDWPGTLVSGRFPLRSWPRALNAALEWQDRGRDWVIRRGDPLAYLWIVFDDRRKVPRLVEAARTPAFERHYRQIGDVISYGRNVGPMFEEAERRRPARLLTAKPVGCPDFD